MSNAVKLFSICWRFPKHTLKLVPFTVRFRKSLWTPRIYQIPSFNPYFVNFSLYLKVIILLQESVSGNAHLFCFLVHSHTFSHCFLDWLRANLFCWKKDDQIHHIHQPSDVKDEEKAIFFFRFWWVCMITDVIHF